MTRHASLVNKLLEFFEWKLLEMWKKLNLMKRVVTASAKALLVSFEISYLIDKSKKSHTIGETLLLLAAIKTCEIMRGGNYGQALKQFLFLIIP
jgi:hypothetical protein